MLRLRMTGSVVVVPYMLLSKIGLELEKGGIARWS